MSLDELDRWLRAPRQRKPAADGIAMLDGFVAAIVAGPATYEALGWLCPLLGVTRDAINDGDTEEYAALAAAAQYHNALAVALSEAPGRFAPIFGRMPTAPSTSVRGVEASMPPSSSIQNSSKSCCPPAGWRISG
jgi:uncharacterized protein